MELQLCQVAFILTTLFGEFDARAILSRHSEITRPVQSLVQKLETIDVKSEVKQFINKPSDTIDHRGGLDRKHRSRRFALHNKTWSRTDLTWTIPSGSYPSSITSSDFKDIMTTAFRMWAEVSKFTFRYEDRRNKADIEVSVESKWHNCDAGSFDGQGGKIAHASYPETSSPSFIHFDGDEQWTVSDGTSNKYSLLPVALHEIGHVLGLKHSSHTNAVMFKSYNKNRKSIQLDDDDVAGIQQKYGPCEPEKLQAAGVSQSQTYFFKDDVMWRYNHHKDESERGYPRKISRKWSGLPARIDSMFEWRGNTYFVVGDNVYRTNQPNNGIDPGYPKKLFRQFSSYYVTIPSSGPAVGAVSEFDDGHLYIFRGSEVFRVKKGYNIIEYGWPKSISTVFPDFPLTIDSIFYNKENDKLVYIFSGEYYYTYSSTAKKTSGPYLISSKFNNLCLV